jgi:hypothetical protein
MSEKPPLPKSFLGEGWKAFFALASDRITELTEDPDRKAYATASMSSVLFGGEIDAAVRYPEKTARQSLEDELIGGMLALHLMIISLEECEYYFKKYPFKGIGISRADHLRNICEMYFDRVVQFKDRLKTTMNVANKLGPDNPMPVGKMLKIFEKSFGWEIRRRNFTHHHGRFSNQAIEKLSLVNLLSHHPEMHQMIPETFTYRQEVKEWIQRLKLSAGKLYQILEWVSDHVVKNIVFGEGHAVRNVVEVSG